MCCITLLWAVVSTSLVTNGLLVIAGNLLSQSWVHSHLPSIFSTIFDVGTCGLLNNHSFQLMDYALTGPCPSDLPDSRQQSYMWLLCGAAEPEYLLGKNLT